MSFYSSQVGKKSRYCDSSLYGNNLSSVYADGPPPLDDSTQDEDEDEMVFKSKSREKSPSRHDNTDKAKDIDAQQPWPTNSSNDDFGDFSSFADFSSAFGGTKNTTTESQSSWFNSTNGDHSHSARKSLNNSIKAEVKATNSDDDDFGCFSGGDESDFENFKSFPEKSEMKSDSKNENVSNGISNNLVTQQNDCSTQHATSQNNVLQTDLFSDDDDDDEMNDFQSSNPGVMSVTDQPTNSNNDDVPMSPLSVDIPPILSDDNEDDDDEFGDFSSSNFNTSNFDNSISHTKHNQFSGKCPQDMENIDKSEKLSQTSIQFGQNKDLSDVQQSCLSNKHGDSGQQKSNYSTRQHDSSDIEDDDDFGDFNSHFVAQDDEIEPSESIQPSEDNNTDIKSSHCQNSLIEKHEQKGSPVTNQNNGDDIECTVQSQSEEKSNNNEKPATTLSPDVHNVGDNDDSDFSSVSEPQNYSTEMNKVGNAGKCEANSDNDDSNNDEFGKFRSTDTDPTCERTSSNSQNNQDEFGNFSNFSSASKPEFINSSSKSIKHQVSTNSSDSKTASVSTTQSTEENKTSTLIHDKSDNKQDDDDDFGDFSNVTDTIQESTFGKFSASQSNSIKGLDKADAYDTDDDDDFGDFGSVEDAKSTFGKISAFPSSDEAKSAHKSNDNDFGDFNQPSSNKSEHDDHNDDDDDDDFGEFDQAKNDNDFGDFNQPSSKTSKYDDDDDDNDFGEFDQAKNDDNVGDFNQSQSNKPTNDGMDFSNLSQGTSHASKHDDFGDFNQTTSNKPATCTENNGDDFKNFGQQALSVSKHYDDDDFGDFGQPGDDSDFSDFSKPSNSDTSFGNFGKISTAKLKSDDNDFGEFGKPSSESENDNEDDFGDFSEGSATVDTGFADFKTSSDKVFSNTKSSNSFGTFSSGNQSSQSSTQSSYQLQSSVTMATSKDSLYVATSTKSSSVFEPQKTPSITVINNLIKQGFIAVQSDVESNLITIMLEHELNSGKPSVWGVLKGSERDGSLRFEWLDSDHKLKMLEALSMLPVRIQTSASFKSSGPVQTPLFASGLGLLEPTKGVFTPFHHGVEEINPSQDPFGAPPEVGIPDLGFGGKGNGSKKDVPSGNLEIKDSSDTISVSSSLDLDFLAPASSTGDLTKPEGKALFEDDLLGLGMQFTASNESPTVFNTSKDQKKIFKFNTTAVLPKDDKNLSESARKIADDFEDLSFMLSKVLMFPLKSNE